MVNQNVSPMWLFCDYCPFLPHLFHICVVVQLFKFTASTLAKVVAPGLSVSGLLEFTPEEEEEVRDCLLIHIDDVETITIPLMW